MRGWRHTMAACWLAVLIIFACGPGDAFGQLIESSDPIGGITFKPPRRATIRHKAGKVLRGDLIGVSPERVHFRVQGGKEFQYPLKEIRSIVTTDGELKFTTAHDTYRELVEMVAGLKGVTVDAKAQAVASNKPIELPRPPAPPVAVMLDSPDKYQHREVAVGPPAVAQAGAIPPIPQAPRPVANTGVAQPFHETGAFKIGFLIACLAVVALWWRSKVG